ncbi:NADH ubiquinone oxidoreductase subunit NDUFA12-domain-containing protein [Pelagophyceae sp. CCMP2097]|nr:NADH ubiquinone oxidoreductase subunit NDUFA12-domain-containing protein [Pelagophyceae sp. CCMP2097]
MALERYTLREIFDKCNSMGTVRFGNLVGEDHYGNKYYEDMNEQHGQHRWVEYKDKWNYDASMVPPSWHGWIHHMYDEPGDKIEPWLAKVEAINLSHGNQVKTDQIYSTHLGRNGSGWEPGKMMNQTQMRYRGYKIGNLHLKADEPETYYKQPGTAASTEGGAFNKKVGDGAFWDPNKPAYVPDRDWFLRDLKDN